MNIANLVAHLLGFLIALIIFMAVLRKIVSGLIKLFKVFAVFGKLMRCIGFCIIKMSLGLIGDEVIYKENEDKQSNTQK